MKELRFVLALLIGAILAIAVWKSHFWTTAIGGGSAPMEMTVPCEKCGKEAQWQGGRKYLCTHCFHTWEATW